MAGVAVIALYWSYEAVHVSAKLGSVTDGLRVSKVWFLMAVPIGFGLIVFRLIQSMIRDFRKITGNMVQVLLIEGSDHGLPSFPEKLSSKSKAYLEQLGVDVLLNTMVMNVSEAEVQTNTEVIPTETIIWAAGVRASKAAEWLDMEADRAGRAVVTPQLNIPEHENIFVIGDTASVMDKDDNPVPGIAPAAKQQGKYVGKAIKKLLKRKTLQPFKYKHAGNLATIGPSEAVIDFGRTKLRGTLGWWVWGLAHIYFLIGNRSKIAVSISWIWAYFSGQRSARLITQVPKD